MKIAVEGCCHGQLDEIYATLEQLSAREGVTVDLLICCGDFQAVRNADDLECLACPPKYRRLGTFHEFYTGARVAPVPTLFIGGNHEASNHLWELYYGGWVAPRIYYLGAAGVVTFGGVRIAGLSGIFNARHYRLGHFEAPPYSGDTLRSAYHVRALEVFRLRQLRGALDVFLSHDWPQGIVPHGNAPRLLRAKPFLRDEVRDNSLGSPPAWELLQTLRPRHWFSAHLHVKFAALVAHPPDRGSQAAGAAPPAPGSAAPAAAGGPAAAAAGAVAEQQDPAEAEQGAGPADPSAEAAGREGEGAEPAQVSSSGVQQRTEGAAGQGGSSSAALAAYKRAMGAEAGGDWWGNRAGGPEAEAAGAGEEGRGAREREQESGLPPTTAFLALDKCLPGRNFLQVVDLPDAKGPLELGYDAEWLAILRATHGLLERRRTLNALPGDGRATGLVGDAEVAAMEALLAARGGPAIPHNFAPTAAAPGPGSGHGQQRGRMPQGVPRNPQTAALLEMLGLPYDLGHGAPPGPPPAPAAGGPVDLHNPEEIELDDALLDEEDLEADAAEPRGVEAAVTGPQGAVEAGQAAAGEPQWVDAGEPQGVGAGEPRGGDEAGEAPAEGAMEHVDPDDPDRFEDAVEEPLDE